jgi:triosephosphate isomerase
MLKPIVANWKMNPASLKEAVKLAKASDKKGAVVVPPFVFIEEVGKVLKRAALGAQDVFWKDKGAYTGEISPEELKRLGVKYVIIGHSERRALGEKDSVVNKKAKTAVAHGFKVILCVGEKWNARKKGFAVAKRFVADQLRRSLKGAVKNVIVAYEPVWAIGTGRNDSPEDASEMALFIKKSLGSAGTKVLYGGSVNGKNAKSFLEAPGIDGLLVGGASLKEREFNRILRI